MKNVYILTEYFLAGYDRANGYCEYLVGVFDSLEAAIEYSKMLRNGMPVPVLDEFEAEQEIYTWTARTDSHRHVIDQKELRGMMPARPLVVYKEEVED